MKKILILLAFILTLSFTNVFADIRAPYPPTPPVIVPTSTPSAPVKDEKPAGFCYVPTAIAGILFSLSIISFGLRFMRDRQTPLRLEGVTD